MKVNFFWKGDRFSFVNYITVLSHIKVGHRPIIWLSGTPNNEYIDKLKKNSNIQIKNADDIFKVEKFLSDGGNFKTASALWRFYFLYEHGGLYADTDAYAVSHFPETDWIIASGENKNSNLISNGVIKAPAGDEIFLDCIKNIKYDWGNVEVFTNAYLSKYKVIPHDLDKHFYPFSWKEWNTMFKDIKIPNCYSVHLYHQMLEKNNKLIDEDFNTPSLMLRLVDNVRELI